MPLPSSGPLSINDIRTALGTSSGSLRTLSSMAGFSPPDAISEFYGYGPSGVSFEVNTGLYPLSGSASTTVTGNIINNTSNYLYMSWKFNSAGVYSGTLNAGQDTYTSGLASGQLIGSWLGYGSEIIQSMFTVNPNSSRAIIMSKNDGYGSGSYIRIGYATTPSGTISWL